MTLIQNYTEAVAAGTIQEDPLQRQVLCSLQRLTNELENTPRHFLFKRRQRQGLRGLYLYGPVGAGKTFLMDLFYQHVTESHKVRVHFHQFMQQLDAQLRTLQGHPNPLQRIAEIIAKSTRLLCLDEFFVEDIATAMILAQFFPHVLANGITLVVTSNTRPDDLYLNGLQRVLFLPVIGLLKQHCQVFDLHESKDYRLGRTPKPQSYIYPLGEQTQRIMEQQFNARLTGPAISAPLMVQGRSITFIKQGPRIIWFLFDVICNLPRSQLDYLELAERFDVIFVSELPSLRDNDTVKALLFTHFIDVMYDRRVKVIISAEVPIEALYPEGEVSMTFRRTRSRLQEMQSADYSK